MSTDDTVPPAIILLAILTDDSTQPYKKVVDILTTPVSLPKTGATPATVALLNAGASGVNQPVVPGPIFVSKKVNLAFTFIDPAIRPIGIVFKQTSLPPLPPPLPPILPNGNRGDMNMPFVEIKFRAAGWTPGFGPAIQVPDNCTSTTDTEGVTTIDAWEYYILFQTPNGAVGIIDPELENNSD